MKKQSVNLSFAISLWILLSLPFNIMGVTFTVVNVLDAGPGSLRDAIITAENTPGLDTIDFNIPGSGVQTIYPLSQLPQITKPAGLFINGLTQTGATVGSNPPATAALMIEINGAQAGASHGIWIISPLNTIQGLVIDSFEQDGIRIQGVIEAGGTFNNLIYCNFIGTDPTGNSVWGNGRNQIQYWAGVNIIVTPEEAGKAFNNTVKENLISGNYAEGVGISNCPPGDVYGNRVVNNYIGTDITGMKDFGNQHDGVYIGEGAHDNTVDTNVISGNDFEGVCIVGYAEAGIYTNRNIVHHNIIGLTVTHTPLKNTMHGVSIGKYGNVYVGGYSIGNIIGPNNIIAHNGLSGVMVWEHTNDAVNADSNKITQNSIYTNGVLGIDLQDDTLTPNDSSDLDSAANQEVNFPVITSSVYHPFTRQTIISGTLNIDTDPKQATIEIYLVTKTPSPYSHGEGDYYLVSTTPDSTGSWTVTVADTNAVTNKIVTTTATDMFNNTSEFCLNDTITEAVDLKEYFANKTDGYKLNHIYTNSSSAPIAIRYSIPVKSHVNLRIYDLSGKLIKIIAEGIHSPSYYSRYWNGRNEKGKKVSSGCYFYTLEAANFKDTKKLVLTR